MSEARYSVVCGISSHLFMRMSFHLSHPCRARQTYTYPSRATPHTVDPRSPSGLDMSFAIFLTDCLLTAWWGPKPVVSTLTAIPRSLRCNWPVGKGSQSCTWTFFLTQLQCIARNWLYFHTLYKFSRYVPILKLVIFGHETWPSENAPEDAYTLRSFYPSGSKVSLPPMRDTGYTSIQHSPMWVWNIEIWKV